MLKIALLRAFSATLYGKDTLLSQIEPQNKAFQTEKQKCLKRKEVLDQKRREKNERDRKERETKEAIDKAINVLPS